MSNKQFLMALLATAAIGLSAGAKDTIVLTDNSGKTNEMHVGAIEEITFSNGNIIITTSNGKKSFPLGDLDNIAFDYMASSNEDITIPIESDVNISISGTTITAEANSADKTLNIIAVNTAGMIVAATKGRESVSIDFSNWPRGIYIIVANDKTIKFIR